MPDEAFNFRQTWVDFLLILPSFTEVYYGPGFPRMMIKLNYVFTCSFWFNFLGNGPILYFKDLTFWTLIFQSTFDRTLL